ncbi:MAG: flagellar hook-associated protein FlgK [Paracoccaceae bacterium]|jgi:flagellar hook-associated protein 1 FlgK|nr:flagellar hook-associated protein FlgK [Paracoccaceae bacterium]
MSITNAFVSSRSGLAATAAWSEMTANNIANADRVGYVRRGLLLTSGPGGSGVQITGIRREVDGALDRMHRQEMSRTATQDAVADGLKVHAALLGKPGDPQSIPGRITALQSRLDELSNDPAQPSLQRAALDAAAGLAAGLQATSGTLSETAANTRAGIEVDVATLNRLLTDAAELNRRIALSEPGTRDNAMYEDTLATKLDEMSELVDLRVQRDPGGNMVIYTAGGTPLLEGRTVHTLTYSQVDGRLFAGDVEITPNAPGVRGFDEGRLAGRFALLNDVLPRMQTQLDETARMLVQSFTAADTTVAPGQPGLFTDAGAGFDPLAAQGLAARISINEAVRGPAGDTLWRMRDGMGAAVPGPESANARIEGMIAAFGVSFTLAPEAGLGAQARLTEFVPAMIADQQVTFTAAQDRGDALRAGAQALETARLGFQGVNVDDELQQLVAIEQSYAANAVMMRTLGEMMDTLLAAF